VSERLIASMLDKTSICAHYNDIADKSAYFATAPWKLPQNLAGVRTSAEEF